MKAPIAGLLLLAAGVALPVAACAQTMVAKNIDFTGAPQPHADRKHPLGDGPMLMSVRKAQLGADYLEGVTQRGVHEDLFYALKELGFLDESVGPIGHAGSKVEANRITVVMTGAATPGDRYKVARVTLPAPVGTVKPEDLLSEQQVTQGGLPSPSLVDNTVARMAYVYQGHGFLDAKSSVDETAHTISYTFAVTPGEVYHMREVLFASDLNANQKAQLTKAWNLPKGAVNVPIRGRSSRRISR